MLTWSIQVANEYGISSDELGGEEFDYTLLNDTASGFSQNATEWKNTFTSETPIYATVAIALQQLWKLTLNIFTFIAVPIAVIGSILINVLHVPPVAANVFIGIVIVGVIFAIWRLLRTGE